MAAAVRAALRLPYVAVSAPGGELAADGRRARRRALRQRAEQLAWRADGAAVRVQLDVPARLPALPAAVEVAAYRIATEALTNVVRHSRASRAVLELRCGESLDVEVIDDGPPNGAWQPGVGLQAMRERAAELGGRFEAGPSTAGGRVYVSFPLVTA